MKRIYPKIRFEGNDWLKRLGVIYSQTLQDVLMKIDDGSEDYKKGFMHVTTVKYTEQSYYSQMWTCDTSCGLIELARAGFTEDTDSVIDYIIEQGMNEGDHYGRIMNLPHIYGAYEVNSNAWIVYAFYQNWRRHAKDADVAKKYVRALLPMIKWIEGLSNESPYGALVPARTELAGNPDAPYLIYSTFNTYAAALALEAFSEMADVAGDSETAQSCRDVFEKIYKSISEYLVSKGVRSWQNTRTKVGAWINGIDERTKMAADIGQVTEDGPFFDTYCWTRQLAYIQNYDIGREKTSREDIDKTDALTYEYIKSEMVKSKLFRKYGFVSCTAYQGNRYGNRHDDTMAGYGQNYFTQAALLADDVNVYTKCLEGISRLAYDGDVVAPMTEDLNPFYLHECFNYENYEEGLDHTFGTRAKPELNIVNNPGDEGNLQQSSTVLKTISLVAGVGADNDVLCIRPRLPWECSSISVTDYPVCINGKDQRISYKYDVDRVDNTLKITIKNIADVKKIHLRLGPLPYLVFNEKKIAQEWKIEKKYYASFISKEIENNGESEISVLVENFLE